MPEIVGALLAGAVTVIANAGNDTVTPAELTLIWILAKLPSLALVGMPVSAPFAVLKVVPCGPVDDREREPLGSGIGHLRHERIGLAGRDAGGRRAGYRRWGS